MPSKQRARDHDDADLAIFVNSPKGRGRVKAVHHLSGGNHRVYISIAGKKPGRRWRRLWLVELYKYAEALTYLGKGLVQSLTSIPLKEGTLDEWRKVWEDVGADEADMVIPLRIFRTGCRFLQTRDPRVLFDLAAEEQRILEDLLQIQAPS